MPLTTEERLAALEAKVDHALSMLEWFKSTAERLMAKRTGALARTMGRK